MYQYQVLTVQYILPVLVSVLVFPSHWYTVLVLHPVHSTRYYLYYKYCRVILFVLYYTVPPLLLVLLVLQQIFGDSTTNSDRVIFADSTASSERLVNR